MLEALVAHGLAEPDRAHAAAGLPGPRGAGGPRFGISHVKVGADAAGLRPAKLYLGIAARKTASPRAGSRPRPAAEVGARPVRRSKPPGRATLAPAPGRALLLLERRTQAHVSAVPLPFVSRATRCPRGARVRAGARARGRRRRGRPGAGPAAGGVRPLPRGARARRRARRSRAAGSDPRAAPGHPARCEPLPLPDEPVQPGCVYCYASSGPAAATCRSHKEDERRASRSTLLRRGWPTRSSTSAHLPRRRRAHRGPAGDAVRRHRFRAHAERRGLVAHGSTITNGAFGRQAREFLSEPGIDVMFSYDGPRQAAQRPTAGGLDSRARGREEHARAGGRGQADACAGDAHGGRRGRLPSAAVEERPSSGSATSRSSPRASSGRRRAIADGPPEPSRSPRPTSTRSASASVSACVSATAAFNIIRVGDGAYCGAVRSLRGVTPDGYVSSCVEATRGAGAAGTPHRRAPRPGPGSGSSSGTTGSRQLAAGRRVAAALPELLHGQHVRRRMHVARARAAGRSTRATSTTACATRADQPRARADLAEGRLVPEAGWLAPRLDARRGRRRRPGMEGGWSRSCRPSRGARGSPSPRRRPFLPTRRARPPGSGSPEPRSTQQQRSARRSSRSQ